MLFLLQYDLLVCRCNPHAELVDAWRELLCCNHVSAKGKNVLLQNISVNADKVADAARQYEDVKNCMCKSSGLPGEEQSAEREA